MCGCGSAGKDFERVSGVRGEVEGQRNMDLRCRDGFFIEATSSCCSGRNPGHAATEAIACDGGPLFCFQMGRR